MNSTDPAVPFPRRKSRFASRRTWFVVGALLVVALVLMKTFGGSGSDGYRPTEKTLKALELDKKGKEKEANRIYLEEAKKGDRFAQFAVGSMHTFGHGGVEKDLGAAIPWYERSAQQGNSGAQHSLAHIYLTVDEYKDVERGLKWLKKSVDAGNGRAISLLGLIHEKGEYVKADKDKALSLYQRAAEKGSMDGLINLASLTEQYNTLTNTRLDIYKWNYILEQLGGHELAGKKRKRLEESMGSWDITRGRWRARVWLFLYGDEFISSKGRG